MSKDSITVSLDALPIERVPAAIAQLSARLLTTPASAPSAADLLTPQQVAEMLNVSPRYVARHAKDLGVIRVSARKPRFRRSAVERYIKGRTT